MLPLLLSFYHFQAGPISALLYMHDNTTCSYCPVLLLGCVEIELEDCLTLTLHEIYYCIYHLHTGCVVQQQLIFACGFSVLFPNISLLINLRLYRGKTV